MKITRPVEALSLALFVLLNGPNARAADQAVVVAACGAQSLSGQIGFGNGIFMDETGNLCTNAGGGGSGGAVTIANGADTAEGSTTDAPATVPTTSTAATIVSLLKALINVANNPATFASQYPSGAVPITASATGTTTATTATLAASTLVHTYICGYSIRANATANTNVTDTVTGVVTGTMSSALWVPANTAGLGVDEQIFQPCIPSSAINTAVAVVSGAPGTGGVVTVKAWGYQQ